MTKTVTPEDIAYLRSDKHAQVSEIVKRIEGGLFVRILESLDPCTYPHCGCSNICKNIDHEYSNLGAESPTGCTGG